jgi:hypothetical protein
VAIEIIPGLPDNVVGFIAKGEVHRHDYEATSDPIVEEALARNDKIRVLYVLGADFTGFSAGAEWEDTEFGMKHLTRFEMIAVVTDQKWIRHAVNLFGYLMPGKVRVFSVADEAAASEWLTS